MPARNATIMLTLLAAFVPLPAAAQFMQGGNSFGAAAILGTNDPFALELIVNGSRVMRYGPEAISPNLVGGSATNGVAKGVRGATIAGGGAPVLSEPDYEVAPNRVTDRYGTVGGGAGNRAGPAGRGELTPGPFATVGGGLLNNANGVHSTVSGGAANTANDYSSTVAGGSGNDALGGASTVSGGQHNRASGDASTVAGGFENRAAGDFAFAVGHSSRANGDHSVAIGRRAVSDGDGSFQFADNHDFDFRTTANNAFRARATGGVRFVVDIDENGNTTWSCLLTSGNNWSCSSDRDLKQGLVALDGRTVLDKLVAMPVYQWQPKGRNSDVRHYGPMAQDFHATFGLGDDDRMLGFQDVDGVALSAIQGLNAKLEAKLAEQAREIAELRRAVERLVARDASDARVAAMR